MKNDEWILCPVCGNQRSVIKEPDAEPGTASFRNRGRLFYGGYWWVMSKYPFDAPPNCCMDIVTLEKSHGLPEGNMPWFSCREDNVLDPIASRDRI